MPDNVWPWQSGRKTALQLCNEKWIHSHKLCFMKKTILILTLIACCFVSVEAQKINYESSIEKAKKIALQQQKPLAILITIQPPVPMPDFMNGLNDDTVINKLNSHFINYKVAMEDTVASRKIIRDYKIVRFPSYIFLDSKGGLLFTDAAFIARAKSLLDIIDKAIAATKEKSLVDYDSAYNAGNKSTAFLRDYILRRRKAGITNNADLIETYVNGLTVSDLKNYAEVLFILKAGPIVDSNAYKLVFTNRGIVDSIFKTEPMADRVAMNSATIENSMIKAIAEKSIARAYATANFTRNSWTSDPAEAQKKWYMKMLQYYNGVKDTAGYLQKAAVFYDQYYMRISLDSVRKKDSLRYETAKNKAMENAGINANGKTTTRTFSFSYAKDSYATELNNAAWSFYQYAGNINEYLLKAMLWSKRCIEYSPKPAYYDTYAHLLYRLKFYDEAESMQKNAIESGKAEKSNTTGFEEEYKKIKNRTL